MTTATVLAILVAAGESRSPASTSMASAAAEVVGDAEGVRVVDAASLSDAEALRVERALGVRAVVALAWGDAGHLRARLRLHAARTDRWIDRDFSFAVADTPAERGRALGFAMASMLPEGDPSLPLATAATEEAPKAAPAPRPPGANAFEGTFLAAAGLGGPASGLGGRLAYERFVTNGASLDVVAAVRRGHIPDLDARTVTSAVGVGGAFWPLAPTAERRLGVAIRGEGLLLYESVSHTATAGATTSKGHAVPGAALTVAATCRLAGPLEVVVAGGVEIALGTVDVTVVAAPPAGGTARLPTTRGLAEVGLRARF